MEIQEYSSSALPWPNEKPVNYGYDIEAVIQFGKRKRDNDEFVKIKFPNGKEITSYDCGYENYPYIVLFNKTKQVWQAEKRAVAKEISLDELLFDASDNSVESIYEMLHKYCVQGKNICVEWDGKILYSLDASWFKQDVNIYEIELSTPEEYAKKHPNINTVGAEYVTSVGLTFDEAVNRMVEANKSGLNIYTRFGNSSRIYSAWSYSIDDVYMQGFGISKQELEMGQAKMENEFKKLLNESDLRTQTIADLCSQRFTPDKFAKSWAANLPEYKDFDDMVLVFAQSASKGLSVCSTFQGKKYWSCEMTSVDDLYKQQFGKTFSEIYAQKNNDAIEAVKIKLKAQQEERNKLIQQFYDEGLPYVGMLPDEGEWRECLDLNCLDDNGVEMIPITINVMKCLCEEDFQQASELLLSVDDQTGYKIRSIVQHFHPECHDSLQEAIDEKRLKGPDLNRYVSFTDDDWLLER